jgi:hypothetical protein
MKLPPVPLMAEVLPEAFAVCATSAGACVTAGVAAGLAFTKLPAVSEAKPIA